MTMYAMTDTQFQTVYNVLSFALASMMATTIFLWMRVSSIEGKYKSAVVISGLVTFIAAYHYMRIFNSWDSSYAYSLKHADPELTGLPFNDAYRYMDWLLTVPLLLMELVLVMDLSPEDTSSECLKLGVASALMIIAGYPGELVTEQSDLGQRWKYWCFSMIPFMYVVYSLMSGLNARANTVAKTSTPEITGLIRTACTVTVISWLTYPVVYIIPMVGVSGSHAIVGIQVGYCISDIISKCGVGLLIYQITSAKSAIIRPQRIAGEITAKMEEDGYTKDQIAAAAYAPDESSSLNGTGSVLLS
jgi:bacteriorhodopsin